MPWKTGVRFSRNARKPSWKSCVRNSGRSCRNTWCTLASNVSSIPEVAGDAALLVDPTDVSEIAEGLARLLTDHAYADDLRHRGLQRAATFTWAATARATLDVYRQLTGASTS